MDELDKPKIVIYKDRKLKYPIKYNGIIYFPLNEMKFIGNITDKEAEELKKYSTRTYIYEVP